MFELFWPRIPKSLQPNPRIRPFSEDSPRRPKNKSTACDVAVRLHLNASTGACNLLPSSVLIDKSVTFFRPLDREAGMAKGRAVAIVLDDMEKRELTALTRKHGAPQVVAERARIVLAASIGLNNKQVAAKIGVCAATVGTWRNRFADHRMDGLYDEPRPGAPREIGDDEIASTIRKTLETRPKGGTHWSLRSMAREIGHAPSTVHRIWRAFGLQPHRVETFKLSTDPLFVRGS
jgi:transposase